MIVVGTDVHKRTHTFVAVNDTGRKLGETTLDTTSAGNSKALGATTLARSVSLASVRRSPGWVARAGQRPGHPGTARNGRHALIPRHRPPARAP
jgi:hypothetical protein